MTIKSTNPTKKQGVSAQAKSAKKKTSTLPKSRTHKTKCTLKSIEKALIDSRGCKSKAAESLGCSRVTLDSYIARWPKLGEIHEELVESRIDEIEEKAMDMAAEGHPGLLMFMLRNLGKRRGYFDAKPEAMQREVDTRVKEIVTKLQAGEITATYAALAFTGLGLEVPDSVRLLLQKETFEAPDPTNGEFSPTSEEEMMERVNQRIKDVGTQVDGLPGRKIEIQQLKDEMKGTDSFSPAQMEGHGEAT